MTTANLHTKVTHSVLLTDHQVLLQNTYSKGVIASWC